MPRPAHDAPVDTRQRILDVAASLIAEQGYAATSLREVAEQLDITKAALYYHFKSKDEIISAIVGPVLRQLDAFLDVAEAKGLAPGEVVRGAMATMTAGVPHGIPILQDPALGPGGIVDLGFAERRGRLIALVAGPDATPERTLRAHAALAAAEGLVTAAADLLPPSASSTDAALAPDRVAEVAVAAALGALGD